MFAILRGIIVIDLQFASLLLLTAYTRRSERIAISYAFNILRKLCFHIPSFALRFLFSHQSVHHSFARVCDIKNTKEFTYFDFNPLYQMSLTWYHILVWIKQLPEWIDNSTNKKWWRTRSRSDFLKCTNSYYARFKLLSKNMFT